MEELADYLYAKIVQALDKSKENQGILSDKEFNKYVNPLRKLTTAVASPDELVHMLRSLLMKALSAHLDATMEGAEEDLRLFVYRKTVKKSED